MNEENNKENEDMQTTPTPSVSVTKDERILSKTKMNKGMDLDKFFRQDRHIFVMTDGGKPIYSRYGDEIKNSEILATISAIMAKFTVFNTVDSNDEKINYISNDKCIIVFLKRGHIIFLALSKMQDSVSFLYSQLNFLYLQLVSMITKNSLHVLETNPNNILKLLSGLEQLFEQMIELTSNTIVSIISAYQVLPMENRQKLNDLCSTYRGSAALLCLLSPNEIIALSKADHIPIVASDIILIQNHLLHNESIKFQEYWIPICLPGIAEEGHLALYCKFVENIFVVYISDTQEDNTFLEFSTNTPRIINELKERKLFKNIEKSLENKNMINKEAFDHMRIEGFIAKVFPEIQQQQQQTIQKSTISVDGNNTTMMSTSSEEFTAIGAGGASNTMYNDNFKRRTTFSETVYKPRDTKKDPLLKLKYAIMKHQTLNQFFSINFGPCDQITDEEKSINAIYGKLYDLYSSHQESEESLINKQSFFHYEKTGNFTHAIFVNETYLLLATFNFFMSYDDVNGICRDITKLVKAYENNFFINLKP